MYRTLLRTIQKMLNSHQRCSNSSIFCINAKTCTTRNLHEVLQARTYQRNICENFAWFLYYPCSHRTLFWSSGWCHWRQWPDISAEREPVGHPWQFKVKKMKDMRERNFLILIYWIMEGWCLINKLAPSVICHHFSSTQFLFFPHLLCRGRRSPSKPLLRLLE